MSKNNILIVDDDENIAELISLYLNKECYETEIAASGTEALQLFEEYSPDLVLLDVMLPGMDGYQVCTEIRKTSNTTSPSVSPACRWRPASSPPKNATPLMPSNRCM